MNGEIEELKKRLAELEHELAEMRALVVKEKAEVPARLPFKYDRARRAYYSKVCLAGAQILVGTAVAAGITSLATGKVNVPLEIAVVMLMLLGGFLIYIGGKLEPPEKEK